MKKVVFLTVPLLLLFAACQKPNDTPDPQPLSIKTDSTTLNIGSASNSLDSFSITANTGWSISVTPSTATWLLVSPAKGTGNAKILVTATAENTSAADRSVTLVITPTGNSSLQPINITINQKKSVPSVVWSKTFGGALQEQFNSMAKTADGGYLLVGTTTSSDGDVSGHHGGRDAWVTKVDATGNKVWSKVFGGAADDIAYSIITTSDGGYVVAGSTKSNDGDLSGNHGDFDAWVLKLDAGGNKIWSRLFGGSLYDDAVSVVRTSDGNYLVAGNTSSNNGDVGSTPAVGGNSWVVKLDDSGNKLWSKVYVSTNPDHASSIANASDGGYVIAGHGWIKGANGSTGFSNAQLRKIDANGNEQWGKTFGGSSTDDDFSVIATADGGYLMVGRTNSTDGDVSGNYGDYDAWIIKLDAAGNKQWAKTFGGSGYDGASSVVITSDAGYLIAGRSKSSDGDGTGNHGDTDGWLFKLDTNGSLQWIKKLGGTLYDATFSIVPSIDGGYVLSGYSISNDGDVRLTHASYEGWLIKVKP